MPEDTAEKQDQYGESNEDSSTYTEVEQQDQEQQDQDQPKQESSTEQDRIARLEAQLEQQSQLFNALLARSYESAEQPYKEQETRRAEPTYEDLDWEDPEALKKNLPKLIKQEASSIVEGFKREFDQGQTQNAAVQAQINARNMMAELEELELGDLVPEIQSRIQQWRMGPAQLAAPDGYQSVAIYALGERMWRQLKQKRRRPPNLGGSGPSEESTSGPRTQMSELEQQKLREFTGGRVSASDIDFFNRSMSSGPVSIDDFERHESSKNKKRGKS